MIEFLDRLAGPIDTDSVRIYRRRTSVVQLIVMIVLSVYCNWRYGLCGFHAKLHYESHHIYKT